MYERDEEVIVLKRMTTLLIVVAVLAVAGLIWYKGMQEEDLAFSVHDLNWNDVAGMNEKIFEAFYTDSPHVYDAQIASVGYLDIVLDFFRDNLDYLSDTLVEGDLAFKMHFTGITGEEKFLGDIPSSVFQGNNNEFIVYFNFPRALDTEFINALNDAGWEWAIAENPDAHNEEIMTLSEVDWDLLLAEYDTSIFNITLEGSREEDYYNIVDFNPEDSEFLLILEFLKQNQNDFSGTESEAYKYIGGINLNGFNDEEPLVTVIFFMNEQPVSQLVELIGEEAWERARR